MYIEIVDDEHTFFTDPQLITGYGVKDSGPDDARIYSMRITIGIGQNSRDYEFFWKDQAKRDNAQREVSVLSSSGWRNNPSVEIARQSDCMERQLANQLSRRDQIAVAAMVELLKKIGQDGFGRPDMP